MAKRKTPKAAKPKKISNEHLNKMQNIINNLNRGQLQIGDLETKKYMLLEHVTHFQNELMKIQKEMKEEYGTDNINIQTGELSYE
mgnify:FL=1|jgi:hypothetical protein|tara:strand:- start:204 stop:458 length:255 start_codon:yes stop_codon:yes gene_type:complete